MNIDIPALVETVSQHAWLVVILIAAAALLEASLGLGVVVPGETIVVLGAVVLSDASPLWVGIGALMVAVGASGSDHIGFWIGRRAGPPLRESKMVDAMGVRNWDRAMTAVDRQGLVPLIFARQLPGVRTLVAAACGAARIHYRRFATASVIGASTWALLWTVGGALIGRTLLEVLGPVLPFVVLAWIVGLIVLFIVRRRRNRSAQR